MKNHIIAEISGLKCDTPTCDYTDESVKLEECEASIDKPCPKCGASLLTPEDFAKVKFIMGFMNLINEAQNDDVSPETDEMARLTVELNGTDDVKMTIEPVEPETEG